MLVGTMMASEVPTQSCMRTSSGTPRMRNTSYSTGTMTAPPPMPNRPASSPVTTPLARMPSTSSAISPGDTPNIGALVLAERSAHAAAVRMSASSRTSASASSNVCAPAPGLTPSVARWRRNSRAPGTA